MLRQPVAGTHESVVQVLLSSQLGAVPAVQTPATQVSAPLHRVPSLHAVPVVTAVLRQPSTGSQESAVHGLPSSQSGAVPTVHAPAWQVSSPLQALPSLQAVPLATAGC